MLMLPSIQRKDSGLTLIELVAAMVILMFGVVAALSLLVEANKSNALARAKNMAINRAQEELETIFEDPNPQNVANSPLAGGYDGLTFNVPDEVNPELVGPGGNPPGLITVGPTDPHVITITVTWVGQGTLPGGTMRINAVRSEVKRDFR